MVDRNTCLEQYFGFASLTAQSVIKGSRMVAVYDIYSIGMEAKNIPQEIAQEAVTAVEDNEEIIENIVYEGSASASWSGDPTEKRCNLSLNYTTSEKRIE